MFPCHGQSPARGDEPPPLIDSKAGFAEAYDAFVARGRAFHLLPDLARNANALLESRVFDQLLDMLVAAVTGAAPMSEVRQGVELIARLALHPTLLEQIRRMRLPHYLARLCNRDGTADDVLSPMLEALANCSGDAAAHRRATREILLQEGRSVLVCEMDYCDVGVGYATWDAAVLTARWLLRHSPCVAGKHVLELGAGTGVVGLAAAAASARSVVLSDYLPQIVSRLQDTLSVNGQLAGAACALDARELDWDLLRTPEDVASLGLDKIEVIVASEVIYEMKHAAVLAQLLCAFFSQRVTLAVIGVSERPGVEPFMAAVRQSGLQVEVIAFGGDDCCGDIVNRFGSRLLKITRAA